MPPPVPCPPSILPRARTGPARLARCCGSGSRSRVVGLPQLPATGLDHHSQWRAAGRTIGPRRAAGLASAWLPIGMSRPQPDAAALHGAPVASVLPDSGCLIEAGDLAVFQADDASSPPAQVRILLPRCERAPECGMSARAEA